ncbi:MAG TPA: TetR/AcrR family transcriptional regulator [Steroidobacteraceae bacterium]|nr:TetR/AcrR family transcriptional regulator [Steroidobacteraceae bacterium]
MAPRAHKSVTHKFHQRRDTIVRAAVEVLNHKGVRGMTLADVAAKIDLVPTAVMYYFRKKEDLAAACFHKAIEQYESMIAQAQRGQTAREALELFVRGYFEFRRQVAAGEADQIAVYNDVRAVHDPGVGVAYTQMFRNARSLLLKSPEIAALPRMDCNARTHLLLAQLFWSVVWVPRYYVEDYPRLADHMLDILENGLVRADREWQPRALHEVEPPIADGSSEARETFLQAATSLMNDLGYHGASVQKISERLNVTKGAFYHHLDTKDDLILACFERTLEIVRRAQLEGARAAANGADNLIAVAAALVEYQLSGKAPLLRTAALTSVPQEIRANLVKEFDRASGRFSLVCSDGIADSSLRPVDAAIASQMITALINAAAEVHAWAPGISQQNVSRSYARPLFQGLLSS